MRKRWKVLPLAAMATMVVQFSFVGAPQAQTTGPTTTTTTAAPTTGATTGATTSGITTTGGGTVGGTTAGATTGGVAPTPIPVQPRFTG